jgi:hypothetical protein
MSTATAVLDLEKAGFTREQVEALAASVVIVARVGIF